MRRTTRLVQLGGNCRGSKLSLINLANLAATDLLLQHAFVVNSQHARCGRSVKSRLGPSVSRVVQQAVTTDHGCLFPSVCTRRVLLGRCRLSPRRGTKIQVGPNLDQAVAGAAILSFSSVQVLRTSAVISEQSSI
jgi:hypothetical protein